jgi:hypothetical protein
MLIIYIAVAAYLISRADHKALATGYAFLSFVVGFIVFAFIGFLLMQSGIVKFKPWYEDNAVFQQFQLVRFVLGALQTAFSLYLLHVLIQSKGFIQLVRSKSHTAKEKIRSLFPSEILWRTFLVLQVFGLVLIIYVDTTNNSGWDFLPDFLDYRSRLQFDWDFLKSSYWTRHHENWLALFGLLGPFAISKSIVWVQSAK